MPLFPRITLSSTFFVGLIGTLGGPCQAAARPFWPIPALSSFDGSRWGNLQLNHTTFKGVQANYETGKGAYPGSTELSQPENTPLRVDLLWDKRGDTEILRAITVRFEGSGPKMSQIAALFDPQNQGGQAFYRPGRFEAWRVVRFAARGVTALTLTEGATTESATEFAPFLLLGPPNSPESVPRGLVSAAVAVETRLDAHEGEPKVMEFGEIDLDTDLGDGDLYLLSSEVRRAESQIALADAQGTIRYRFGGDGSYQVRSSGADRGKKGGSVTVSAEIEGSGPYGPLRATGSGTESWTWSDKEKREERHRDERALAKKVRDAFRSALSQARREAEASFARQMLKSGPPPLAEVRESQWREIIENARAGREEIEIPEAILK